MDATSNERLCVYDAGVKGYRRAARQDRRRQSTIQGVLSDAWTDSADSEGGWRVGSDDEMWSVTSLSNESVRQNPMVLAWMPLRPCWNVWCE